MKSNTLPTCTTWLKTATPEQIAFTDSVYAMCEDHYADGGDTIVECYGPQNICNEFKTLDEVREYCGLQIEQALNARWGEDSDPEVARAERFKTWEVDLSDPNGDGHGVY